jgi:hypothetical protein
MNFHCPLPASAAAWKSNVASIKGRPSFFRTQKHSNQVRLDFVLGPTRNLSGGNLSSRDRDMFSSEPSRRLDPDKSRSAPIRAVINPGKSLHKNKLLSSLQHDREMNVLATLR